MISLSMVARSWEEQRFLIYGQMRTEDTHYREAQLTRRDRDRTVARGG